MDKVPDAPPPPLPRNENKKTVTPDQYGKIFEI